MKTNRKYHVILVDGSEVQISRRIYYELLDAGEHREYVAGEQYYAVPNDAAFADTLAADKRMNDAARQRRHRSGRCRDVQGRLCLWQRDCSGKTLYVDGKRVHASCSSCPRNGVIGGDRVNCCLHNICREDCTMCPYPRESDVPASLDAMPDGGYNISGGGDPAALFEAAEQAQALSDELAGVIASLTENQREAVVGKFVDGKTEQSIADELGIRQQSVHDRWSGAKKKLRRVKSIPSTPASPWAALRVC